MEHYIPPTLANINLALGSSTPNLVYDTANILALRNGANPQTFRIYNTYTDGSNYERALLTWATNKFTVNAGDAAGTGISRDLGLMGGGTSIDVLSTGISMFRNSTSNSSVLTVTSTSLTSTALNFVRFTPTINQASGTYAVLDINPTETAIGAGPHYLIRGRIGAGADVFGVKNDGAIMSGSVASGGVQFKNNGGTEAAFTRSDGSTAITVKAGLFRSTGGTVTSLGAASGAGAGTIAYVTDATATTRQSVAAGGGSNKVVVYSDGTNWLIF